MYTNPSSCILNNGFSGPYFKLGRGVRQGDPLSPYIFILAIELLAIKIRSNPEIIGIRVKNNEFKLSLYADDMTVAVQDTISATKVFDILQTFSLHSGLKVNTTKSEGMWLGNNKNNKNKPFGIKWPQTPIKALGIYHSHDKEAAIKLNFNDKIESLLKQLHWWKARNLSLTGKILIVKVLALSKFSLLASLLSVPKDVVSKVNAAIYHFIWNGKTDKVKRILLEQEYENGGLKMLDFRTMIKGAKIKWITRYLSGENADWKHMLETFCGKENLNIFLRSNFDPEEISVFVPSYYVESIKWWSMIKLKETLNYEQFIWYNKRIKIGKCSVFCRRLFTMGIWKASDLFHNNTLIPFATLLKQGALHNDYMIWRGIVDAIRKTEMITELNQNLDTGLFQSSKTGTLLSIDHATEKQIKECIKFVAFESVKKDDFKAKKKFELLHGEIEPAEWKVIYSLPRILKIDNFTKDLQYKILYRFLPTNKLLCKMNKIQSDSCSFCKLQVDTIEHALWECLIVKDFWMQICEIWNELNNTNYIPCLKSITFGFLDSEDHSINMIVLHGKKYIQEVKKHFGVLNIGRFCGYLKKTVLKIDPNTEKIADLIRTRFF